MLYQLSLSPYSHYHYPEISISADNKNNFIVTHFDSGYRYMVKQNDLTPSLSISEIIGEILSTLTSCNISVYVSPEAQLAINILIDYNASSI